MQIPSFGQRLEFEKLKLGLCAHGNTRRTGFGHFVALHPDHLFHPRLLDLPSRLWKKDFSRTVTSCFLHIRTERRRGVCTALNRCDERA